MWLSVLPLSPRAASFTQTHRINKRLYKRVAPLRGWGWCWLCAVDSALGGGYQPPLGQGHGTFVVWIPVPIGTMNRTLPGHPQASLPTQQAAAPGSTAGTSTAASCLFSRQEWVVKGILHLSEGLTSHLALCPSPDCPLTCHFKR